jgi:hypothetical protein
MAALKLTRNQLASFLPDHETIKQFETLIDTAGEITANEYQIAITDPALTDNPTPFVNYLDFDLDPKHVDKVGRLAWNVTDDTLNLHHTGGVTQQIGQETYAQVINNTGAVLANGTAVGFGGASANTISASKFIANGTQPSLYALGILTQDIAIGARGLATVWGNVREINTTGSPVSETWAVGDILYASPTVAGALTKVKPTAPNVVVPMAAVLSVSATLGEIFVRPTIEQQLYYGDFSKTADQAIVAANTAEAITFNVTESSNGISRGSPTSRIVAANSGLYSFAFSAQVTSNNASSKNVFFWFRKNGTNIVDTTQAVTLSANGQYFPVSRTDFFSLAAGDYIEAYWASSATGVTLNAIAASGFAPASPAAAMAVTQVQQ